MKSVRNLALAALLAFSFTACGSSGSDDGASADSTIAADGGTVDGSDADAGDGSRITTDLDVCGLFSLEDVEAALEGMKMKSESLGVNDTCNFVSEDPADGGSAIVMYQPRGLAGSTVEEVANLAADQLPGDSAEAVAPVDGIDGAFSFSKDSMTQVLIPYGEEGLISVTAARVIGVHDNLASSIQLAEVVAGNL